MTGRELHLLVASVATLGCNDVPQAPDPDVTAPRLVALERWTDEIAVVHPALSDFDFVDQLVTEGLVAECVPLVRATPPDSNCEWDDLKLFVDGHLSRTWIRGDTLYTSASGAGTRSIAISDADGVRSLGSLTMMGFVSWCESPLVNSIPRWLGNGLLVSRGRVYDDDATIVFDASDCRVLRSLPQHPGREVGLTYRGPEFGVIRGGFVIRLDSLDVVDRSPCAMVDLNFEFSPNGCLSAAKNQAYLISSNGFTEITYASSTGQGVLGPDGYGMMIGSYSDWIAPGLGVPVFRHDSVQFYVEADVVLGATFTGHELRVVSVIGVDGVGLVEPKVNSGRSTGFYIESYDRISGIRASSRGFEVPFRPAAAQRLPDNHWLIWGTPEITGDDWDRHEVWFARVRELDGTVVDQIQINMDPVVAGSVWEYSRLYTDDGNTVFLEGYPPTGIHKFKLGAQIR